MTLTLAINPTLLDALKVLAEESQTTVEHLCEDFLLDLAKGALEDSELVGIQDGQKEP